MWVLGFGVSLRASVVEIFSVDIESDSDTNARADTDIDYALIAAADNSILLLTPNLPQTKEMKRALKTAHYLYRSASRSFASRNKGRRHC